MAAPTVTADKPKIVQFRDWSGGLNRTASRTGMRDNQLFACDNAQPIGPGEIRTLVGRGDTIASISAGIAKMWDGTLTIGGMSTPLLVTVNVDGSMSQVNPATGAVTSLCAAGTVTTAARVKPWRDTPLLITDPTKGYMKWDGATFTVIDATKTARDIAVFEGRAWLLTGPRAFTYTSPNTYDDFVSASGSGTGQITDNVFVGSITCFLSALELLWLVGPSAVNTISNVQAAGTPVVTTFSNTNIVANVGSIFPSSVASFFRTFLFQTPYGVYAIVGPTPQKLSEDLDGLYQEIDFTAFGADPPAAVFSLNNIFVWAVLARVSDPIVGVRNRLLCFSRGTWFTAWQPGPAGETTWITALVQDGVPTVWGTDGTNIYPLFDGATGVHTISTKLWDFGAFTTRKQLLRTALEFVSDDAVTTTITIDNETGVGVVPTMTPTSRNVLIWTGLGAAVITWTGAAAAVITWTGAGFFSAKGATNAQGIYLGETLTGTSSPFTLDAIAMEIGPMGEWTL